jgi:hypothetical protein
LYVVSGTITRDSALYEPFLAVQDSETGSLLSARQTMEYDECVGRNNGDGDVIFSTGGIYANGSTLSQAEANVWFTKPSVQQAKQILESLTY